MSSGEIWLEYGGIGEGSYTLADWLVLAAFIALIGTILWVAFTQDKDGRQER